MLDRIFARKPILRASLVTTISLLGCSPGSGSGDNSDTTKQDGTNDSSQTDDSSNSGDGSSKATPFVLRRLNRVEYNHTLRDLFGGEFTAASDFPGDDPSLGFDHISQVQTISALQFELYERAADDVAREVLALPTADPVLHHIEAESAGQTVGDACCNGSWNLWSNGEVFSSVSLDTPGTYRLRAYLFGQQAGDELPRAELKIDDVAVSTHDISAQQNGPELIETELTIAAGNHRVAVAFTNDFYDPDNNADRNLVVDWFELEGPFDASAGENPLRERLVSCDPKDKGDEPCLREIMQAFLPRAFRRPVDKDALDDYVQQSLERAKAQGEGFEAALHYAVKRALLSPHFLFRVELDPADQADTAHEITAYELATRLSYFLWSSMPDDELFARAKDGSLLDEETLRSEVERMLDDPRAQALTDHFAGQWLSLRDLPNVFKDPGTFPEFSDSLRAAMQEERRLFFDSFIRDDRPIQELLTADEAWINSELADFYGVQGADGSNFSKVSVADTSRRGLLGQAGLMAVLGHPESTAPVLRGKWVLDRLLCRTPPPPPGDIEIPSVPNGGMMTMREKLAVHRENPVCAGCHNEMDPIGLSLENFDGIGQFRVQEAGQTIDVSGNLPDGTVHAGPVELAQHIAQSPDFIACSVEKALVYALARDLGLNDRAARAQIQENFLAEGAGMRSLLREIAVSPLFRTRQGVSQ